MNPTPGAARSRMGAVPARRALARLVPAVGQLPLAAAAAAVGVLGVFVELDQSARPLAVPELGAYLVAVMTAALLCWRDRVPLAVTAGIVALCLGYHLLGYPGLAPATAMFVAPYALTDRGHEPHRLWAPCLIAAVALVPLLPPQPAAFNPGALLGPPAAMLAVAALGEASRTRRAAAHQQLEAARRTAAEEAHRGLIEQRLQIARELHDVVAHTLTVISVQAAVGAEALEHRPDDTRNALAAVRTAARDATAELHATLAVLRAGDTLDIHPQPGLRDLPELVERARTSMHVELHIDADVRALPPGLELVIYRITQEALTNAIRHARAARVLIGIRRAHEEIALEIADDGQGPTTSQPSPHAAHGLTGMRERARVVGGTLTAGPDPVAGFRVEARLPVRDPT